MTTASPGRPAPRPRGAAILLLVVLSVLPYSNVLGFDFVWDDRALIVENPHIKSARLLGESLVGDYWGSVEHPERRRAFYRPLVTLSFFVDYWLWGENPAGFHGVNILLHVITVLLVYSCFLMLAPRASALVAAAFFAVHPIHTESVTWISGRTDVLASVFGLCAFRVYLALGTNGHRRAKVVVAGLLYLLAVLSKEVAFVLPGVVLFHLIWFSSPQDNANRARNTALASMIAVGLGYLLVRVFVLKMPLLVEPQRSVLLLVFNLPRLMTHYLVKLLAPVRLYAHDPLEWLPPAQWPWIALACWMLVLALAAVVWLGSRNRKVWLSGVWLVLFLLPVLNAGTITDVLVAERFLYLPSVGFCWMLGSVYGMARDTHRWASSARVAVVVLLGLSAIRTYVRNPVWENDVVLFETIHRHSASFFLPHQALASAYLRNDMPEKAIEEYRHVFARAPRDCSAFNGLALAYYDLGMETRSGAMLDKGFAIARRAITICPAEHALYHTLGEYYLRQRAVENNIELALSAFRNAIALNPGFAQYHFEVGALLMDLGRHEEARPYLAEYVRLAPPGERRRQALDWLGP